ncbi:hypothetical protein VNO80_28721 [Phaseolus coccineus]|uniref:C2 domain-containing protein n=1 Tax=Phaseolus coccineus TaxID=3886 RepID=A0AAN9L9L5_PHACN
MKLVVRVIEAKNLALTDTNGLNDLYVRVQLGKQKFKTKVVKSLNSMWDEQFTFWVDDLKDSLVVSVMDEGKFFNYDYVGRLKVPIALVFGEEIKSLGTVWYSLKSKNKKCKNKQFGEIHLSIFISQSNGSGESNDIGDQLVPPRKCPDAITNSPSMSSVNFSNLSSPVREETVSPSSKEKSCMHQKSFAGRIAQIFNKGTDVASMSPNRSIDSDQHAKLNLQSKEVKFQAMDEIFEFDAMDDPPFVLDVDVYDFDGPFDDVTSLGHVEINFLKTNISDLADIWVSLEGKLAQARRGVDARHGAKTQDEDGRLKFRFQTFVSFNVANRTIMALWKARSLSPEQNVQLVEEDFETKSLRSDESGSFIDLGDNGMSEVHFGTLSVPANF